MVSRSFRLLIRSVIAATELAIAQRRIVKVVPPFMLAAVAAHDVLSYP
jgi:hypothetical protein